jgi:hypothetical protein
MLGGHNAADKASKRQEDIRTAMLAALSEIASTQPEDFSEHWSPLPGPTMCSHSGTHEANYCD